MLHITITCNQVIHFFTTYILTTYLAQTNPSKIQKSNHCHCHKRLGNFKIQKRLGKDRIMDSLKRFVFSNKKILKFKKGWEKIGLWIPLFDFFQIRNLKIKNRLGEDRVMDSLI